MKKYKQFSKIKHPKKIMAPQKINYLSEYVIMFGSNTFISSQVVTEKIYQNCIALVKEI